MSKRRLVWFLGNCVQIGGMSWVIHTESTQWGRVVKLWLWMFGLLAFLAWSILVVGTAIAPKKTDIDPLKLRSVPAWLALLCDFIVAGMCAYVGWVATAVMFAGVSLYEQFSMSLVTELEEKKDA